MVPEDLLFWIAAIRDAPTADPRVLCLRHADAMVVPRGWTLDDRREESLRLFKPQPAATAADPVHRRRRTVRKPDPASRPEQLQIDGTGEVPRPAAAEEPRAWEPDFDADDDLDGLLEVSSPLLARAFRGTGRPKG